MAVDIYLLLYDQTGTLVKGECKDVVFQNAIEVHKVDFTGVGRAEETVRDSKKQRDRRERELARAEADLIPTNWFQEEVEPTDSFELTIEKMVDYASPTLYLCYCQERLKQKTQAGSVPFQKAQLYFCIQGQARDPNSSMSSQATLVMEFTNLHVKEYGLALDADLNIPDETVKFIFETYTLAYAPQQVDGSLGTQRSLGFNFVAGTTM